MKKVPIRKCIACNEHFEKKSLIRVVRTPEGNIVLDDTGKQNGRGAYVCRSQTCLNQVLTKKNLQRVFSCQIEEALIEALKAKLGELQRSNVEQ